MKQEAYLLFSFSFSTFAPLTRVHMLLEGQYLGISHKNKFTISVNAVLHFYATIKGQIAKLDQL